MSIYGHTKGYITNRWRVTLKRTVCRSVSLVTIVSLNCQFVISNFILFIFMLVAFVRTNPSLVFLCYKGRNYQAITGDCQLAVPINFIRGISAVGNWIPLDSFSFSLVSFSCRCHACRIHVRRTRIHNQWLLLAYSCVYIVIYLFWLLAWSPHQL